MRSEAREQNPENYNEFTTYQNTSEQSPVVIHSFNHFYKILNIYLVILNAYGKTFSECLYLPILRFQPEEITANSFPFSIAE